MIPFLPGRRVGHVVDPSTGCWLWRGALSPSGYSRVGIGRDRVAQAHRVYYERVHGPVPQGLELDHLCRNRRCVNPAHLEPVTRKTNSRRGAKAKLSMDVALEIRRRYAAGGVTFRKLGAEYGVSHTAISNILTGKRWAP